MSPNLAEEALLPRYAKNGYHVTTHKLSLPPVVQLHGPLHLIHSTGTLYTPFALYDHQLPKHLLHPRIKDAASIWVLDASLKLLNGCGGVQQESWGCVPVLAGLRSKVWISSDPTLVIFSSIRHVEHGEESIIFDGTRRLPIPPTLSKIPPDGCQAAGFANCKLRLGTRHVVVATVQRGVGVLAGRMYVTYSIQRLSSRRACIHARASVCDWGIPYRVVGTMDYVDKGRETGCQE
ncbi:hypothetical protein BDQ17DRAFT_1413184, partial [Cyathus striatus]